MLKGMLSISREVEVKPLGPVQLQEPPVNGCGPRFTVAAVEVTEALLVCSHAPPFIWIYGVMAVEVHGVLVAVGTIGVLVTTGVLVGVAPLHVPTNETTLDAGSEKVKLLLETGTAACATRPLPTSVSHGVTEVVLRPLRLKAWLTAELLLLIATITKVVGELLLVFL
jgi:hypothetical protein